MLSCYYSLSMATLTGLEPAFIVLETTAYPSCSRIYLYGAPTTNRTPDILITKQVLYQLSYKGKLAPRRGLEPRTS